MLTSEMNESHPYWAYESEKDKKGADMVAQVHSSSNMEVQERRISTWHDFESHSKF